MWTAEDTDAFRRGYKVLQKTRGSLGKIYLDTLIAFIEPESKSTAKKFVAFKPGDGTNGILPCVKQALAGTPCPFCQKRWSGHKKACRDCDKDPKVRAKIELEKQKAIDKAYSNKGITRSDAYKILSRKIAKRRLITEGYAWPTQSPDYLEKCRATSLRKHGVAHPTQSENTKAKARATNLERRGVEYPSQSRDVRAKCRATWLKTLGVSNPSQSPVIHAKKILTSRNKKTVVTKNKVYLVQGYEDLFLKHALKQYKDTDIVGQLERLKGQKEFVPSIATYSVPGMHHALPDFFLKPLRLFIDVKSEYTLMEGHGGGALDLNRRKAKAAEAQGVKLAFVLTNENGFAVLPPKWHNWSDRKMKKFVEEFNGAEA